MSKFHVGDRVRVQDKDGLFEQFALDTYFDASDVSVVTKVDTGIGADYDDYEGVTYEIDDSSGVGWDVPEEVLRPADIFAQKTVDGFLVEGGHNVGDPVNVYVGITD